jgi:hypothetical protein
MAQGRVEQAGQERSGQSGNGGQTTPGDDADHRADRQEVANGRSRGQVLYFRSRGQTLSRGLSRGQTLYLPVSRVSRGQ